MKLKIFSWIFRNELQACDDIIKVYENEARNIKHEVRSLKKQYELHKRILDIDTGAKIIGIETNKKNEELLVVESIRSSSITIKLYGFSYQGMSGLPRIMAVINEKHKVKDNSIYYNRSVYIEDIYSIDDNVGNGSILMKYFLEIIDNLNKVYKMNIKYIDGYLSSMDKDHFDRSEHYYKKIIKIILHNSISRLYLI